MSLSSSRILHWVFKIISLRDNLNFYEKVLGLKVLRHEEFSNPCEAECNGPYARPWSKTMIGRGPEIDHFALELTYNYGIRSYAPIGDDLRYIAVKLPESSFETATKEGFTVDGPFILSPDGYRYKAKDVVTEHYTKEDDIFLYVSINVADLAKASDFYMNVLNMKQFASYETNDGKATLLGYSEQQTKLELVERNDKKTIDHGKAYGRLATATKVSVFDIEKTVNKTNDAIHTKPVSLPTPGKATVEVIILHDRDGYELCYVGEEGFNDLSQPTYDEVDWADRETRGGK